MCVCPLMPRERAIPTPFPLHCGAEGPRSQSRARGEQGWDAAGHSHCAMASASSCSPRSCGRSRGGPRRQRSRAARRPRRPGARAVPCGREESPQRSGNAARGGAGAAAPLPARSGAGARPYPAGRELRALEVLQRLSEGNRRGGRARGAPQPCREAGSGSDPHGALSVPRVIPGSRRRNPWGTRGKGTGRPLHPK